MKQRTNQQTAKQKRLPLLKLLCRNDGKQALSLSYTPLKAAFQYAGNRASTDRRNAVVGLADKKCVWGVYSVEYGYAVLRWNSDHVSPLPHSTGSMLGTGFPA